jgi:hypothetical protein
VRQNAGAVNPRNVSPVNLGDCRPLTSGRLRLLWRDKSMKAFIFGIVFGIALSAAGYYYYENRPALRVDADHVSTGVKNAATDTANYVHDKMDSLNLKPSDIKDELAKTGAVIRRKASEAGAAIADEAADTKVTATIKGKLVADRDLSALAISVSTTDGMVTMSGTATSPANVQKAIELAWDTDGVRGVVSTIGVKP